MMMATLGLRLNTQEDPNCCSAFGVSRRLLQNIDTWEKEVFAIQSKVVDMDSSHTANCQRTNLQRWAMFAGEMIMGSEVQVSMSKRNAHTSVLFCTSCLFPSWT